jgi:DNA-binding NarL/FixJ family response regulator
MPHVDRSISVLCIEDHAIVRDGLSLIIGLQRDMKMVASASTGQEGIQQFRQHQPDVTLVDLQLPDMSGVDVIRAIRRDYGAARLAVLTMYAGDHDIRRALEAGACTYLLKDVHANQLVDVIRRVHSGDTTIPPDVEALLAQTTSGSAPTRREVEVLQLLARGLRNKQIADVLKITEVTVQVHIRNIFAKFEVTDRTAALGVAVRRGIVRL